MSEKSAMLANVRQILFEANPFYETWTKWITHVFKLKQLSLFLLHK